MVLRATPCLIILHGLNLAPSTQDPGPHFSSAMSRPSSSKAAGVSVLSPTSLLTLARLELQLIAPQKCQRLLVSLLLVPALPRTLLPEVPQCPAPQFHSSNWSLVILDITFLVQNNSICQHQLVGLKDIFQANCVCAVHWFILNPVLPLHFLGMGLIYLELFSLDCFPASHSPLLIHIHGIPTPGAESGTLLNFIWLVVTPGL